jgi:hypothetical protein
MSCGHKPHSNLYSPYKHFKAVLAVKINFSLLFMFSKPFFGPLHVRPCRVDLSVCQTLFFYSYFANKQFKKWKFAQRAANALPQLTRIV